MDEAPRRKVSDRLLIAALTALVSLYAAWKEISPAQAAADSGLAQRVERLEDGLGKLREDVGEIRGRLKGAR